MKKQDLRQKISLIGVLFWVFIWLALWLRQYVVIDGIVHAGWVGSWADGAVHLTYASLFAYGPWQLWQHPIFAEYPLTYPFLADALTGISTRIFSGSIIRWHQIWGLVLSLILLLAWLEYTKPWLKHLWQRLLSYSLWVLSGGLGFWYSTNKLMTQDHDIGLEWLNTVAGHLIPQRALLLGLSLGLVVLYLAWQIFTQSKLTKLKYLILGGLLQSLLIITHPHTFMVVTSLIAWWMLLKYRLWKQSLVWISAALCLGLPLLYKFILPAASSEGFATLELGWMAGQHQLNWFWFWWLNWGIFTPAALVGYSLLNNKLKLQFLPILIWFAAANIFKFQPYIWDNSKIFIWVYLWGSVWIVQLFTKIWKTNLFTWQKSFISLSLVISLTLSGGLDLIYLFNWQENQIPMYVPEDIAIAEYVRTHSATEAVFATSDRHTHPIPTLTGRQILMGYRGWLWTYGIDDRQRHQQLQQLYAGGQAALEVIEQLEIDYIVFEPLLEREYPDMNEDWYKRFPLWYESENYRIYQVN